MDLINLGIQVDHFGKKIYFIVKMNSGNQPCGVPLIRKKEIVKKGQQNVY